MCYQSILLLVFCLGLGLVVLVTPLFGHHSLDSIRGSLVAISQVIGITLDDVINLPDLVVQILQLILRASTLQLVLYLVEGGEFFEVLDACGDVDHRGRQFRVLEVHPLVLVAYSREVLLDLVQPPPLWQVFVPHESHFFQLPPEVFLVLLEFLDPAGVAGLQFFEGVGRQALGLELLDDFISVDDSCDLFELPKGLLVVIEFLALVIFIVFVAVAEDSAWLRVVGAAFSLGKGFSAGRHVFVDFILFLTDILGPHFLDGHPSLLEVLQFRKGCLFGVSGIMGQQQKFLKIVLFPLEARLNARQLAIITHSFFPQPLHDFLVGLLDGLRLVEFDHYLIQPIFQEPNGAAHGVLLKKAQLILLNLLQLVLQCEQHALPYPSLMLFLVQCDPEVIFVVGRETDLGGVECGPREHALALLAGHEIIPQSFQLLILILQLLHLFTVLLLDLLSLPQESSSVLFQHLVLLVLVVHFRVYSHCLPQHG